MLYADDLYGQHVAFVGDLSGVVDPTVDELRDVDEPLNGAFQAGEGAEGGKLGHLAGDDLSFTEVGDDLLPALGLGAPQAEGDLLVLLIDLEHVDFHLVAHLEQVVEGLGRALPGELREVDQAVRTAYVNEDAEVADAGYAAGADLALVELPEEAFLLGGALLLHGRPLGDDGAVAAAVQLNDLNGESTSHPFREGLLGDLWGAALRAAAGDLRKGNEGVDALHVDQEAALVAAGNVAFKGLVLFEVLLKDAPALLTAGAVQGEDDLAVRGLRLEDKDKRLFAHLQAGCALRLEAPHLVGGYDALGLGADVDQDTVAIGADDLPL